MILYFSGTGNSRFAAQATASVTGDEIVSLNDLIKKGERVSLHSEKPYVIVCPTYAWRIPRAVESFIRDAAFEGSREAYFILTCGGQTGNADKFAERLCAAKGWTFKGLLSVLMPENYIAMFDVPDEALSRSLVTQAEIKVLAAAYSIKKGAPLLKNRITPKDRLLSSAAINGGFYKFAVKAEGFFSEESCTGCGLCAELCPFNNITLQEGRPKWGANCTHCMACICRCPKEAIEYKRKSQGKRRYYLPDYEQYLKATAQKPAL